MSCKDLDRVNSVIKGEGENVDETFVQLFNTDISRVIQDYFNLEKNPVINISKKSGELLINMSFVADGIKLFKKL